VEAGGGDGVDDPLDTALTYRLYAAIQFASVSLRDTVRRLALVASATALAVGSSTLASLRRDRSASYR
jgi:hypothetical protein